MTKTPSSPADLAAWCARQIEYLVGILDTFDFSRGRVNRFGGYFAPFHKPVDSKADEARYMRAEQSAKKRCLDIYRDLMRIAPLLFPAEFGALPELDHPFRECHKLLAAVGLVQQWCGEVAGLAENAGPGTADKMSKKARALAALYEHPEWSDTKIADVAGCSRTSLYKWPEFTAARELLEKGREGRPRGEKSADADMEAWE